MTLNRFISYSLIIHLLVFSFALISPVRKDSKTRFFYTHLVVPDEISDKGEERQGITPPSGAVARGVFPLPPPETKSQKSGVRSQKSGAKSQKQAVGNEKSGDFKGTKPDMQNGSSETLQAGGDMKSISSETAFIPPGTGYSFGKRIDLLDKEVVERIAQKEAEENKGNNAVTFDAKEFKFYGYMKHLREKIEGIWKYPSEAAMKGIYGDLYISFTIKKDGTLGAVELLRTSGHKDLDDAAVKALRDAVPYWPLPDEWKKDGLTITGHFLYSLYGVYVR
ncbi:MAG: energy transducer TonB [Nitrospirae bacterium]|nr:energy transducer TonB [Nitrospirota bacterium]